MVMEDPAFEDVFLIENKDIPLLPCKFFGGVSSFLFVLCCERLKRLLNHQPTAITRDRSWKELCKI